MKAIQARLAAIAASFLVATLASWGIADIQPDGAAAVERWLAHTFELVLFLGYAIIHPLLQRKLGIADSSSAQQRDRG